MKPAEVGSDLSLDLGLRQVIQSGSIIKLPKLTYRLFVTLAKAAPEVVAHDELVEQVWDGRPTSVETVTQRVMLLRRALGDDASAPRYIGLVRGQGYRMLQTVNVVPATHSPQDGLTGHAATGRLTHALVHSSGRAARYGLAAVAAAVCLAGGHWILNASNKSGPDLNAASALPAGGAADSIDKAPEAADEIPLRQSRTDSDAAAEAYQRGVSLLRRRTGAAIDAAIVSFEEAIRRDSSFVPPLVGLADSYTLRTAYSAYPVEKQLQLAQSAAEKALELDPHYGPAYASLAMVYFEAARRGDIHAERQDPEPLFLKALRLSPDYATAYQWYGEFLAYSGRPESAQQMYERALELDPTSPIMHHVYAHVLMRLGRDADAEMHFRRAIEIDPGFSRAYQGLATHYFSLQGRIADAALPARHAALLNPNHATNFALLASIYLHLGDVTQAEHWLAEANRLEPEGLPSLRTSTLFHLYREDDAAAVESARTGIEKHPHDLLFLAVIRDRLLSEGKLVEAIELYEAAYPSLVIANACDSISGCWIGLEYAYLIKQSDSHARVEELLRAVEARIAALIEEGHPRSLLLQAALYVQREKHGAAVDALRRAVDRGWRKDAFYHLADDPLFFELHDRPAFQELTGIVRADMAAQLQGLREQTGADIFSGRRFAPAQR